MAKATRHLQLQTTLQDRFMNLREAAWAVNITEGTITFTHEGPTGGGAGADRRHPEHGGLRLDVGLGSPVGSGGSGRARPGGAVDGIPTEHDSDQLARPVPPFTAEQAIGVVQSYQRQMEPIYRIGLDQDLDAAEEERRLGAQRELRAAFWRRTDDFHEGGVFGSGNDYAIAELADWHAAPVHERLWQVTYRRPITPDLAMNEGYLVMPFDDAPQLVDLIEEAD